MKKLMPEQKRTPRVLIAFVLTLLIPMQALAATVEPQSVGLGESILSFTGTSVYFGGSSSSAVPEESLTVISYLQRMQGSTWITIDSASKFAYNTTDVSVGKTVTVTGGYYYRTKSYHQSCTNGVALAFYSYSSSRWVS